MARLKDLPGKHRRNRSRALIVADGVFSMDGDLAALAEPTAMAGAFDSRLIADDAHGIGGAAGEPVSRTSGAAPSLCKWAPCRKPSADTAVVFAPRRRCAN